MATLVFLHGVPLGETDPLFGRDVGVYLFQVPAAALSALIAFTLVALIGSVFFCATRGVNTFQPRRAAGRSAAGVRSRRSWRSYSCSERSAEVRLLRGATALDDSPHLLNGSSLIQW
jgi:hypothetical protein